MMNKIAGIMAIILGLKVLLIQNFSGAWSSYDFSSGFLFIPVSFLLFYVGYLFIRYNPKEKKEKYTKCPNCKEVFNYGELINGKCKNCKDVDTIDLDEYFKKYPDELIEEDDRKDKN
jgi:hypothetical protein